MLQQGHPEKEHFVVEFSGVTIKNGFQGHDTEQKLQCDEWILLVINLFLSGVSVTYY
jgi:hypothetical protein